MAGYNRQQETVNALIHAAGIFFGIIGLPVLIGFASSHGNMDRIAGSGIYAISFLMVFTSSTIYHFVSEPRIKRIFLIIDHISIYFLIAGTYTPFLLLYMNNTFGITLLCILWGLTFIGIFFKIFHAGKYELLSTIIYAGMGLILFSGGSTFFDALPGDVVILICVGAFLYLSGIFFYLWDKYLYTHAVWHTLVLAAAICHFIAVFLAV
ncbi:hemolysin III family protein [soil metagenome]